MSTNSVGQGRARDGVWVPEIDSRLADLLREQDEVDGIHHMDAAQYWADMDRDNGFTVDGYRVLRFPAFVVRYHPAYVAGKIRDVLTPALVMSG
jgi:very-short-patch-repair endonuclease